MKILHLLVATFLISLSICLFASSETVEAAGFSTVSVPTLSPFSPITLGGSVTANVIVGGIGGTPIGTITFQYSTDNGATWNTLGANKTLSKGSATSDPYTPRAVGNNYRIRAVYSGDSNYNSATGNAASLTVNKANPTVPAPSASPNPVFVNNTVTVSVFVSGVSGGATPTGTVTFQVRITTSSWSTIDSAVSLSNGSASTAYVPQTVGSYQFQVVYSGDSNYNGVTGSALSVMGNFSPLDHFAVSSVGTQTAGTSFSITVTANDVYGNTVTGYTGTPSLTYSAESISPGTMNAFVNGVGSTSVMVTAPGSDVNITVTDGACIGVSNSFTVTNAPTPTPELSPLPTPTSTSNPTSTPKATPTPTPKQSPSPTPLETTVKANTDSGATVNLAIKGNITSFQISNVTIATTQSATSTAVSFTVIGESGTTGFSNMTIPKTAISYGDSPVVFIDGQQAPNQGYMQDTNNYYVWYTTQFSTHKVIIQFAVPSTSLATSFGSVFAVGITIPEIILIFTVIAVRRLRRKPDNI